MLGAIWVHPDPRAGIDLKSMLGEVYPDFAAFQMADHHFFKRSRTVLRCNWKLVIEAFQDGYHVVRLHNKSIGPLFKDAVACSERLGQNTRAVVARANFDETLELPAGKWDPRQHATFAYYLFPNTEIIMHPDYISLLSVFPKSADETVAVHTCLVAKEPKTPSEISHWERAFDIIDRSVFFAEDYFVCEKAQEGMRSGANKTLLTGADEKGLRDFHDILAAKLGMGDHRAFASLAT